MHLTGLVQSQSVRIVTGAPFGGSTGTVVSYGTQTAMVRVASHTLPYSLSELRKVR